ncbi:origin recognition complex subunit 3 [Anopheles maculipalpis]|uniref:origin recognition complex subunit 3 n=1 Tax=Anopheles maculipalpis TaxID=1496333 RepID=UPI002158ADEE|nr:origin recognition complex subunit 3 [Anopheles maculipalpis]
MDATNSVSKGVFVFKNEATRAKGRKKVQSCSSFLDASTTNQLWFRMYKKHWERTWNMIIKLQTSSYSKIIGDLLKFIESCQKVNQYEGCLPTAALLTGFNQNDHWSQFEKLADDIQNNTFSIVVLLPARDGANLKQAVETIVERCVESQSKDRNVEKQFRKNQFNLDVLEAWYQEAHARRDVKPNLVIIVPDFESFNTTVLQDLIIILDSYATKLPFVLVFGVATDISTIHSVLPYHVTSKIKISVFQSEPSTTNLNNILNEVLLTPYCPFHLSSKVFKLLVDIFLFYDFSVNGFIQGFKYALMDHYFQKSINGLSAVIDDERQLTAIVHELSPSELEQIRQLPSFRPYVESLQNPQEVIDLLTDDDHLKRSLTPMIMQVHNYWFTFHCALHVLHTLVSDLPKAPLGKQIRELYCLCVASDVTKLSEFKECIQLLSFLSKEEMLQKIQQVLDVILIWVERNDQLSIEGCLVYDVVPVEEMANGLVVLSDELVAANHDPIVSEKQHDKSSFLSPHMGRQELREKLLTAAKHSKSESAVTKAIERIMEYFVKHIFCRYLRPATSETVPLVELFLYNDSTYLRQHIVGAPRAAVHIALNNPQYYTQCDCCTLDESSCIVPSLPDLSIAYKLHLECGRMINLFDWLQAFRTILEDANKDGVEQQVDPIIQARFTRVVAEMQFLGFIKTSKTKTDHVTRLTW